MSAASFATSTAPATEMPTSAACSEGASLMPSPMIADDVPAALERQDDAVLLGRRDAREDGGLLGDVRRAPGRSSSSSSSPSTMSPASSPTCLADVARRPARCRR